MTFSDPSAVPAHIAAGPGTRHIGILLFEGVEELDAVGPWEVLSNWVMNHPQDGWTVSFVSKAGQPVHAAKGAVLGAHHSFADVPPMTVLIYPGGPGTRTVMRDEDHLAWVRLQRATVPLMASVCTGALVYAAAGVLARRPATTHWQSLDLLHSLDGSIDVQDGKRFVDDGDVLTSAGVTAGIDMGSPLIARLAGVEQARAARRDVQYDPQPPI